MRQKILGALFGLFVVLGPCLALAQQAVVPTDPVTGNKAYVVGNGLNVNVGSLPLPSNAAEETGGNLQATATGIGAPGSTACSSDTGSCNLNALEQRLLQRTTTLISNLGSPLQQSGGTVGISGTLPAFASTPTFNCGTGCYPSTQPVSAASLPLPSNAAQESGGNLASTATNTATTNTDVGAPGSTACASDTASCSINQLAQRIAQRLTSVITTLGSPAQAGAAVTISPSGHAQTPALASGLVAKAAPGTLYSFEVSADATLAAATWYVLIFDATSAPADGAVTPAKCYQMLPSSTLLSASFTAGGVAFTSGITIVASTAGCFTKAASAHAFIGADYQ